LDLAGKQGKIENFRIAAGAKGGTYRTHNAADSDVYKLIEDAAYSFATRRDADLERRIDVLIGTIVAAQQPDGYLNTQFTMPADHPSAPPADSKFVKTFGFGDSQRWSSRADNWPFGYSQLYCAGHLMEAAVAHFRATGKRDLLDAAIRNADHIAEVFTPDKIRGYADHPEIEIGLMKLHEVTADPRYLELADRFARFSRFSRPPDFGKKENTRPLHEQRRAYGHAVRTAYVYAGATDVVRSTGAEDLRTAIDALWRNVTAHKMYIHGGTGNGSPAEQHGHDDDLPIGPTYSESCAAIAQAQWNHRLNLLTGASRHADLVEWISWNNALAGVSLDGRDFFYSNKLNIGTRERRNEHSGVRRHYLFCCPSKVPGFVTGIGRWIYAKTDDALVVNQFIGGTVETKLTHGTIRLSQESSMPWAGKVALHIHKAPATPTELRIRIPAWTRSGRPIAPAPYSFADGAKKLARVSVGNETIDSTPDDDGYLRIRRTWKSGDRIDLAFELTARRIHSDASIEANLGRVAISRGPLLYCLEETDNDFDPLDFELPPNAPLRSEFRPDLLGGVTVITGEGRAGGGNTVPFTAVPYNAWQNRGIGGLATLLIENRGLIRKESGKHERGMNTNG
ncbi:MAG: glycoside hydrolase family 127 protein, partial [Verrucomicrobiae bacterium]|nr:glycoside hydrolase family 127 protein [Verrucomicrobiae bacterium]